MNFDLTEQQQLLKRNVRRFMESEIISIADEYEKFGSFSKEQAHQLLKKHISLGYLDGPVPAEQGGQGLDFVSYGVMLEEAGYAWASVASLLMAQLLLSLGIAILGNEQQRGRFLAPAMSGDKIGCACFTEPDVGSNLANIQTTATLTGDHYVINGTKTWISNGTLADIGCVLAVTRREPRELGFLIVEKESSPFTVRELHKLGLRAFPSAELTFEECTVPSENLLGNPQEGYRSAITLLQFARSAAATISVGIAQAALDAAIKYAQERSQFGKPIGCFQLIQEMIVDMAIETETARFLAHRAWFLTDKNAEREKEVAMAKAYATEMAVRVSSRAIQIHGAYGLSTEYALERYFRDARVLTILDGTTEIMKLTAGRRILGLSAFV